MTINLDKLTTLLGNPSDIHLAGNLCQNCRGSSTTAQATMYKHCIHIDQTCQCGLMTVRWLASIPILEILNNLKILNNVR